MSKIFSGNDLVELSIKVRAKHMQRLFDFLLALERENDGLKTCEEPATVTRVNSGGFTYPEMTKPELDVAVRESSEGTKNILKVLSKNQNEWISIRKLAKLLNKPDNVRLNTITNHFFNRRHNKRARAI